jgi:hypothetical protein
LFVEAFEYNLQWYIAVRTLQAVVGMVSLHHQFWKKLHNICQVASTDVSATDSNAMADSVLVASSSSIPVEHSSDIVADEDGGSLVEMAEPLTVRSNRSSRGKAKAGVSRITKMK